jgi:hypothetical protein
LVVVICYGYPVGEAGVLCGRQALNVGVNDAFVLVIFIHGSLVNVPPVGAGAVR